MKNAKVTFKKLPRETGLSGIGAGWRTEIKLNKKVCGYISGGNWRANGIRIMIAVKDSAEPNCGWSNKMLKNECKDEKEAREKVLEFFSEFDVLTIHTYKD